MIRFRPLPGLTVASLIGIAILVGLGQWQVYRLHWKLGLIAAAQTRSQATPVPVESLVGRAAKDIRYTHASVQGEFLNDKESYLFTQLEDERIGFDVLTPLRLPDGKLLLVDRGFVPQNLRDPAERPAGEIEGPVTVTGVVRIDERPGLFTPKPDLTKKIWYDRDVDAIGAAQALRFSFPFILASDRANVPGGYPEGGHTRITFYNHHLEYALTWFSLAVVLLIIYLAYHKKRGRLSWGPQGS